MRKRFAVTIVEVFFVLRIAQIIRAKHQSSFEV
jgi:hypothetical protein